MHQYEWPILDADESEFRVWLHKKNITLFPFGFSRFSHYTKLLPGHSQTESGFSFRCSPFQWFFYKRRILLHPFFVRKKLCGKTQVIELVHYGGPFKTVEVVIYD